MKHNILIVDDDSGIRDVLTIMLEDEGYGVATASDGAFLDTIHTYRPDVILLDIWLSGINGEEIFRKLKKNASTRQIPVIIVSANVDTEGLSRRIGADDFIVKPFAIEELLTKIDMYCRKNEKTPIR